MKQIHFSNPSAQPLLNPQEEKWGKVGLSLHSCMALAFACAYMKEPLN